EPRDGRVAEAGHGLKLVHLAKQNARVRHIFGNLLDAWRKFLRHETCEFLERCSYRLFKLTWMSKHTVYVNFECSNTRLSTWCTTQIFDYGTSLLLEVVECYFACCTCCIHAQRHKRIGLKPL